MQLIQIGETKAPETTTVTILQMFEQLAEREVVAAAQPLPELPVGARAGIGRGTCACGSRRRHRLRIVSQGDLHIR